MVKSRKWSYSQFLDFKWCHNWNQRICRFNTIFCVTLRWVYFGILIFIKLLVFFLSFSLVISFKTFYVQELSPLLPLLCYHYFCRVVTLCVFILPHALILLAFVLSFVLSCEAKLLTRSSRRYSIILLFIIWGKQIYLYINW